MNIVIHLDGGIIQAIATDGPLPAGTRLFICDTDTEGAAPDERLTTLADGAPALFWQPKVDICNAEDFATYVPKDFKP